MSDKIETGEFTPGNQYTPLDDKRIAEIAKDVWAGQTFVSWSIPKGNESLLPMIFMPLMFIDEITRKTWLRDKVAHFYAPMKDAGPRAINGYPMFMSMGILNQSDAERIIAKLDAIQKAMEAI